MTDLGHPNLKKKKLDKKIYEKVNQSRNRPGVAQKVPGGLGSRIFMTFGT